MHSKEFIKLISEVSQVLGIKSESIADDWSIRISKGNITKYIVGYTLPLNDSACYKIARNKNLCSEILRVNNIPNVPHQVVYSPYLLERRKVKDGNFKILQEYVNKNGFPFFIKKNNSTKGQGVYLLHNEAQLENTLSHVSSTEATFCLSPLRYGIREFRNVILDGKCMLSYEKHIPFVVGDGASTLLELISKFLVDNKDNITKTDSLFDVSLMEKLTHIPDVGEKVFLQWKHNRFPGTWYTVVDNPVMQDMAILAAKAINARFVSVDIIHSQEWGFEVLEINASVSIHFPIIYPDSGLICRSDSDIFKAALKAVFDNNSSL